jgi:hypothetical protein
MLLPPSVGCLAGVVLAFCGRSGSCSRRIDITISSRRSFLPACLPLSIVVALFLFTFLAPPPPSSPFLSSPLRLLLSSSSPSLSSAPPVHLSSLRRLSFLILIGPYPPHTLYRWCLLPRNPRQPLLFCSIYTFHPVRLIYINIHIFIYIYKYSHIHIYKCASRFLCCRLVHPTTPPTASTAVDFAPSLLAVRFLVGSQVKTIAISSLQRSFSQTWIPSFHFDLLSLLGSLRGHSVSSVLRAIHTFYVPFQGFLSPGYFPGSQDFLTRIITFHWRFDNIIHTRYTTLRRNVSYYAANTTSISTTATMLYP